MKKDAVIIAALATAAGLIGFGAYKLWKRAPVSRLEAYARALLQRAAVRLGRHAPPLVMTTYVDNAASDGFRVLVNPEWMRDILDKHCDDEACQHSVVLGVLAHEMAHHVAGDALSAALHPHAKELRADYLAGQVLAAEGVSANQFACVIHDIARVGTRTHPAGAVRAQTIGAGYQAQMWHQMAA